MFPSSKAQPQHGRQQKASVEGSRGRAEELEAPGDGGAQESWASSPIFKAEWKALVVECGPPNSIPWGSVAD